jgi:hypothetical protein
MGRGNHQARRSEGPSARLVCPAAWRTRRAGSGLEALIRAANRLHEVRVSSSPPRPARASRTPPTSATTSSAWPMLRALQGQARDLAAGHSVTRVFPGRGPASGFPIDHSEDCGTRLAPGTRPSPSAATSSGRFLQLLFSRPTGSESPVLRVAAVLEEAGYGAQGELRSPKPSVAAPRNGRPSSRSTTGTAGSSPE